MDLTKHIGVDLNDGRLDFGRRMINGRETVLDLLSDADVYDGINGRKPGDDLRCYQIQIVDCFWIWR